MHLQVLVVDHNNCNIIVEMGGFGFGCFFFL